MIKIRNKKIENTDSDIIYVERKCLVKFNNNVTCILQK